MFGLTVKTVVEIVNGKWIKKDRNYQIKGFSTDTRFLRKGEIFIGIKGKVFNGNLFFPEALEKGAAAVIINDFQILQNNDLSGNIIFVNDTVESIQSISAFLRQRFTGKVIAITGSTGKTIVKDMLASILEKEFNLLATPLSFHGQIGLPLTLFNLKLQHNLAILEHGISQRGEMEKLEQITKPDIAVLTNISETHLEHLGSIENVAEEKSKILSGFNDKAHTLIINEDDIWCKKIVERINDCNVVTFGMSNNADYFASDIAPAGKRGYWFNLYHPKGYRRIYLNAPGKHNIYNALAATATACQLGISFSLIKAKLAAFHLPQMRLEIHTSSVLEENITIINDTYSASPASMKGALDFLVEMDGNRKIAVLGDMLELGNFAVTAHKQIGEEVYKHRIDLLISIGELAEHIGITALELGMSSDQVIKCEDIVEAEEILRSFLKEGDVLLVKGSRLLQLERLTSHFIGGIRPTRLIIDLEAIAHNIREIKSIVGKNTKIMAVVKSGGYGHDSRRVAKTVLDNGADWLAVAVPDEGIFLRNSGFSSIPILVLGPTLPQEAMKLVKYKLRQAVTSIDIVIELEKEAKKKGCLIPIHIKVDTGMGRIGLQPDEVLPFLEKVSTFKHVTVEGIMTHLSSAEDSNANDFTRQQIDKFSLLLRKIQSKGYSIPEIHAVSSAGLIFFPEAHFTMVRPGIMIYGLYPSAKSRNVISLQPAASFVTRIAYIKKVKKGTPISYSRTFTSKKESYIGTIPVGYYDGYNRLLSNKASVLVHGKRAPVVGNVTMDMTMIDVTDISEAQVGDEVVLFGKQDENEISLDELAKICGTIHYELIGNVSARVSKVYREG